MSSTSPLNAREAAFVREYLRSGDATAAFIKAGYAAASAAPNARRMMRKDNVQAAIARERAQTCENGRKTLDDLVEQYTMLGFTDMSRFLKVDDNGEPQIDMSACSMADLDLMAEVSVETFMDGKGEAAREVKRIKIKSYGRYKALAQLATHQGLGAEFKPKDGAGSLAALLKQIMDRGTALPFRPQGPLGSVPPSFWKN